MPDSLRHPTHSCRYVFLTPLLFSINSLAGRSKIASFSFRVSAHNMLTFWRLFWQASIGSIENISIARSRLRSNSRRRSRLGSLCLIDCHDVICVIKDRRNRLTLSNLIKSFFPPLASLHAQRRGIDLRRPTLFESKNRHVYTSRFPW